MARQTRVASGPALSGSSSWWIIPRGDVNRKNLRELLRHLVGQLGQPFQADRPQNFFSTPLPASEKNEEHGKIFEKTFSRKHEAGRA